MNTTIQTLKGFRDFLPEEARKRNWLKNKLIEYTEAWGYEPLETPTLEPLELFAGEIGEDEKLFFSFTDQGGRKVALRYDQTVPTCRVIGQYADKLVFPFRRYQIQSTFRAEKPQKGRYREFTQFDIDIFGIASPLADAEVIASNIDIYQKLGFKNVIILVNNRDLMKGFPYEALVAIDKLKKIGEDGVIADMVQKGIAKEKALEYLTYVKNLNPDETISSIFSYLKNYGFSENNYQFAPTLARSFSYSQGPIWEIVIPEYQAGSVGGGERYDGMMKRITGRDIPATGIAFGFDRTLEAIETCGLLPAILENIKVLVTVFIPDIWNTAIQTSALLRNAGVSTELYPDPSVRLEKQLKYADKKGISFVIIQGPEEVKNKTVQLKNMKERTSKIIPVEEIVKELKGI
ncbi:MAG: Histidyl-tRNA synthetase [Microgenomates group bacterium GW2011_GWC1_43_11]|nr:MAG: Histidyl-tRNA synthetase [Microgenomates group bacterium GW2011_GWC1_43_11]HCM81995.1 histidine--tRNA ligase [Patescibacteria group bacterium]